MGATVLTGSLLLAITAVNAQHTPGQFPPGWNKLAMTPPMVRALDPPTVQRCCRFSPYILCLPLRMHLLLTSTHAT
eukprot:SAG11_NODE_20733_length_439_cov_1.044118_1_plen_75_part_01